MEGPFIGIITKALDGLDDPLCGKMELIGKPVAPIEGYPGLCIYGLGPLEIIPQAKGLNFPQSRQSCGVQTRWVSGLFTAAA